MGFCRFNSRGVALIVLVLASVTACRHAARPGDGNSDTDRKRDASDRETATALDTANDRVGNVETAPVTVGTGEEDTSPESEVDDTDEETTAEMDTAVLYDTDGTQLTGDPCGSDNPWECAPLTNAGCGGNGNVCAWGSDRSNDYGFFCYDNSTQIEGEACGDPNPYCGPGLICGYADYTTDTEHPFTCKRMCCDDEDCDANSGQECLSFAQEDLDGAQFLEGKLGACVPPPPDEI